MAVLLVSLKDDRDLREMTFPLSRGFRLRDVALLKDHQRTGTLDKPDFGLNGTRPCTI